MRRFELAGTPLRYWEIAVDGTIVRLRWGAVDRAAQTYESSFSTEGQAEDYAERQIAAQVARGYVELARAAPVAPPAPRVAFERHQRFEWPPRGDRKTARRFLEITQEGKRISVRGGSMLGEQVEIDRDKFFVHSYKTIGEASRVFDEQCADARYDGGTAMVAEPTSYVERSNAELEAQCLEHPDDPAAWAVYADWLIAHGDVRGEIAALALAGKHGDAKRLVGAQLRELCGTDDGTFELEFRHGFAVRATISVDVDGSDLLEDVTRAFLASPMARFVERLRFGLAAHGNDNDWGPTLHAVATSPRAAHIRELRFDHYDYHQSEISWTPFGDFSGAWEKLPALEVLHVKSGAGGNLGTLDLPNLRTFIRESGGLARSEIHAIVSARWPRLEHLEIWFGSSMYGAEAELSDLRPIFQARGLPVLRHLGIVNCELVDSVIPELARSRILPQLHSLDLSKGVMARLATRYLVEHAAAFRHLAAIDLDANMLLDDELAQIRAVLDNVIPGKQREREYEDDDDDEMDRYVAVGE